MTCRWPASPIDDRDVASRGREAHARALDSGRLRRGCHRGKAVGSKPQIELEALHALARALAGGEFRARAVLERACAAVSGGFGFERVGIVRYIPETSTLVPFAAHGLTPSELSALPGALPIARFAAFQRALAAARAV